MPIHFVKIDAEIPDTSSTWFVGQTIEQRVDDIQANLKSKIKKKSVPSLFASKHKVASPTELHAQEYKTLMAESSTTLENPLLPVKSLKSKLSPLSVQLQQGSIETMELLQSVKLVETPEPLELRQAHHSSKSVKLMQLPELRQTSVSAEWTSLQSPRENLISRLPATIKLTSVNSSDPMCLQCLSKLDKLYYNLCAGRR